MSWTRNIGGDPDHPDLWLKPRLLVMLDAAERDDSGSRWMGAIRKVINEMSSPDPIDRLLEVLRSDNAAESLEAAKLIIQRAIPTLSDEEKRKFVTMIEQILAQEKPAPVTDSEKLADQMARDILSEDVLKPKDRPVVRKALDEADGRTKQADIDETVWRRATGRLANNWRRNPDGTSREVGWYEPTGGGAMELTPYNGDACVNHWWDWSGRYCRRCNCLRSDVG